MKPLQEAIHSAVHEDEEIFAILHRHWFNIASQFFLVALLALLTLLLGIGALAYLENQSLFAYRAIPIFGTSFVLLTLWIVSFFIWVDYHLDIWVITSGRVIDIEQKGMFRREISELDYGHVQDATSEITGIIQTALNYGDVNIQTAGTNSRFLFRNIAQPDKVKTLVMHLHRQAVSKQMHPEHVVTPEEAKEAEKEATATNLRILQK